MGYVKSLGTAIIYISFILAVITYIPGLPPDVEFAEYSIKLPSDVKHDVKIRNKLPGAEVLLAGEIRGPECFASYNGKLYTGILGGYVVQIEEDRIIPIVKFGKKCDGLWQEEKCGRPLALKFNEKGELFVIDAYYGIFKVDVNTRRYVNLVNSSEPIDGKPARLPNFLDLAKNGDIYWTDSSWDFPLYQGMYTMLANPSGRLLRYNAATKKNEVLIKNLGFANGVALSDDESFVIVAESLASRIIKYYLRGPKAGQQEIFVEGLPGTPDNIDSDGQGGFLVSLPLPVDAEHPGLHQSLIPHPHIRKMLVRVLHLIEIPFQLFEDVYPNYYTQKVLHTVGSFAVAKSLDTKKTSTVLRIDKTGKIIDGIEDRDGKMTGISSAYIWNGYLWLGSPWNEYILRAPLKQAFPDLAVNRKPSNAKEPLLTVSATPNVKVEAKPVVKREATTKPPPSSTVKAQTTTPTTTPKPTPTTTPKPTPTTTPKPTPTTTPKPTPTTTPKPTPTTTPKPITTTAPKPKPTTTPKPPPPKTTAKPTTASPTTAKPTTPKPSSPAAKEVKKDTSNFQGKPETAKKDNEATTVKPQSENTVKQQGAHESQPAKPKPVEKKDESVKK